MTQAVPYAKASKCNEEAERMVLAAIFQNCDTDVLERMEITDFTNHLHSLIFSALTELHEKKWGFDQLPALLKEERYACQAKKCGVNDPQGLPAAALLVLDRVVDGINLEYFMRVLREDRARRWVMQFGDSVKRKVRNGTPPMEVLDWVEKRVKKIRRTLKLEVGK